MESPTDADMLLAGKSYGFVLGIATVCFFLDRWMFWWMKLAINLTPLSVGITRLILNRAYRTNIRLASLGVHIAWLACSAIGGLPKHQLLLQCGLSFYIIPFGVETYTFWQHDGPTGRADSIWYASRRAILLYFSWSLIMTHVSWFAVISKWVLLWILIPLPCLGLALFTLESKSKGSTSFLDPFVLYTITMVFGTWDFFQSLPAYVLEGLPKIMQTARSRRQRQGAAHKRLPIYSYLPLRDNEMRLLVLQKASWIWPGTIKASLIHVPVNHGLEYEAVSYRWGSSDRTEEILVDGARMSITQSAFELLLARRSIWKDRTIWIDSVCINQDDMKEKSVQVLRMRDVYGQASRVLAFPSSDHRLRLIEPLVTRLSTEPGMKQSFSRLRQLSKNTVSLPLQWRVLAHVLSCEYFGRAWVFQEIAVGRRIDVYLGGLYVSWETFSNAVANIDQHMWQLLQNSGFAASGNSRNDDLFLSDSRLISNIYIMSDFRTEALRSLRPSTSSGMGVFSRLNAASGWEFGSAFVEDLELCLLYTDDFDAGDARDKLFSMLGVVDHDSDNNLLQPDYDKPKEQVFKDLARYLLFHCRRPSINILALAGRGSCRKRTTCPSWVPILGEERQYYRFTSARTSGYRFHACDILGVKLSAGSSLSSIHVSGIICDKIAYMSSSGSLKIPKRINLDNRPDTKDMMEQILVFVKAAKALIDHHHVRWPDIEEQLWRTFIAGGNEETKSHETDFATILPYFLAVVQAEKDAKDLSEYLQILAKEVSLENIDGMQKFLAGGMRAYISSMAHVCRGRCFGITESGRLFLSPPLVKSGDRVFIPFGAQVPYIIRAKKLQKGFKYELLGEAYVDGYMMGEAIGSGEREEVVEIV